VTARNRQQPEDQDVRILEDSGDYDDFDALVGHAAIED